MMVAAYLTFPSSQYQGGAQQTARLPTDHQPRIKEPAHDAAAGHPTHQGIGFPGSVSPASALGQAIQAMLQEGLNIQCNLRTVVESSGSTNTKAWKLRSCPRGHRVDLASIPRNYFNVGMARLALRTTRFGDNKEFQNLSRRSGTGKWIRKAPGVIGRRKPSWNRIRR